jgi:hypothetical protein
MLLIRFGASFILTVFYIILLPQWWNLLFLSALWTKHPFGQTLASIGLSSPPCCMYEPDQQRASGVEMSAHHAPAALVADVEKNGPVNSVDTGATVSPFAIKHDNKDATHDDEVVHTTDM